MLGRQIVLVAMLSAAACATGGSPAEDSGTGGGGDSGAVTDGRVSDGGVTIDARPGDGGVVPDAGGQPDAELPTACAANTTCAGVSRLGMISGDTGAQTLSAMGVQSQWLRVRLSEDESSIGGVSMTFRATLTSPPGANFDLYLYVNTGSDTLQCSGPTGSATTTGSDVVNLEWGESNGGIANGSDDDRDVSIEIRHVSGTCAAGQQWSLAMIGNQ